MSRLNLTTGEKPEPEPKPESSENYEDAVGAAISIDADDYEEPEDILEAYRFDGGSNQSEIRSVISDLLNGETLDGQSDLTDQQINLLTVMQLFAEAYPGLGLEKFPARFMRLRLSLDRKSRGEAVDILSGRMNLRTKEDAEAAIAARSGY